MEIDDNGWIKYSKLVISQLKQHGHRLDRIDDKLDSVIELKTTLKNIKWATAFIITAIIGIIIKIII